MLRTIKCFLDACADVDAFSWSLIFQNVLRLSVHTTNVFGGLWGTLGCLLLYHRPWLPVGCVPCVCMCLPVSPCNDAGCPTLM